MRNKLFDLVTYQIKDDVDILMITETKLDESFPIGKFFIIFLEILARSRPEIWSLSDCNWTQTHNHLLHKRTLNQLAKLAKWFESSCKNIDISITKYDDLLFSVILMRD